MPANITQPGGTQQRVRNSVQQHIGIGMAQQPMSMGQRDPADDQGPAFHQRVHIKALSDPKGKIHLCSTIHVMGALRLPGYNHLSIRSKSSCQVTLKFLAQPATRFGAWPARAMPSDSSVLSATIPAASSNA